MGVDAETKRRLKAAASAKGVSVSVYCRAAIDKELAQDEERAEAKRLPADAAVKMFEEIRQRHGTAKLNKERQRLTISARVVRFVTGRWMNG